MDVYLVSARSLMNPGELETLGIFDSRERAEQFIDRAPMPQRQCLRINIWRMNESVSDPFWTGEEEGGGNSEPHAGSVPVVGNT